MERTSLKPPHREILHRQLTRRYNPGQLFDVSGARRRRSLVDHEGPLSVVAPAPSRSRGLGIQGVVA